MSKRQIVLSQNQLHAIEAIGTVDSKIDKLDRLHVTEEGATVICNGRTVMIVEPVAKEIYESLPICTNDTTPEEKAIKPFGISIENVKEINKLIKRDSLFKGLMEHAVITPSGKSDLLVVVSDGRRTKEIKLKSTIGNYIDYKGALQQTSRDVVYELVLDNERLLRVLTTLKKIAKDAPINVGITKDNDITFRTLNPTTGQRVFGSMSGVIGQNLEPTEYENKLRYGEQDGKKEVNKEKKTLKKTGKKTKTLIKKTKTVGDIPGTRTKKSLSKRK